MRPLSWSQQAFLKLLADGAWHPCPATVPGSSVRGLMSRGLVERKENPNEHPWTWIREGKFRLVKQEAKP